MAANTPITIQQLANAQRDATDLEHYVNDDAPKLIPTRIGGAKPNYAKVIGDMSAGFQNFLLNSGYQDIGDYGPGLTLTARNQMFWRDGELYRPGAALPLPYVTTGSWSSEGGSFVAIGDAALRQELAVGSGSAVGFRQVQTGGLVAPQRDLQHKAGERKSLDDFGLVSVLRVGVPTDFPTIQAAIDWLHPLNLRPGELVEIVIESGHALTHGVGLTRQDYASIMISSEDDVVQLDDGFAYVDLTGEGYRCVMQNIQSRAPIWNVMVDCGGQSGRALFYDHASGKVMPLKGAMNATFLNSDDLGAGLYGNNSQIDAYRSVFTGNTRGFWLARGTTANLEYAVADNSVYRGGYFSRASTVSWQYGSAKNCGTHGIHALRSIVMAEDFDASNCQYGMYASSGATIDALNSKALNCGSYGYLSDSVSSVYAANTDATGAGTAEYYIGYGGRLDRTGFKGSGSNNGSGVNVAQKRGMLTDYNQVDPFSLSNKAVQVGFRARSAALNIPSGTVVTYDTQMAGADEWGKITVISANSGNGHMNGDVRYRVGGVPALTNISLATLNNIVLTTGVLTGSTGIDGNFTMSAAADGKLYFENRTGTVRSLRIFVTG